MSGASIQQFYGFALPSTAVRALATVALIVSAGTVCRGEMLLDDHWADGSRLEANRPAEAEAWVGREQDVTVAAGALSTKIGESSQKIWTYFTNEKPRQLAVGETLVASVSFIPRGSLAETTSRSFRVGVFCDPTDPRMEDDINDDGGGEGDPWSDAAGYAVQVLVTGGEASYTAPLDLGKRTNQSSPSLLGTSGDYTKRSGGQPATLELDKEYRVVLEIAKIADTKVDLTASLYQGDEELSTTTLSDDGSMLGSAPIADQFDQLYIRISDAATTADQFDFTNFKVDVFGPTAAQDDANP